MRFVVGIDLGTSNCALASVDTAAGPDAPILDFPIAQLRNLGEVAPAPTLPSNLYLPQAGEFPPDSLALPWEPAPEFVVGTFARSHGARVPGRLVTSAKSWLCHSGVDRAAPILPWAAPTDVPRVSPVEASARYLRHLARAWDAAHPEHPLAAQEVVLTVPASFDPVARALTVEAASRAGLAHCTLVEEPQAAFQAFVTAAQRQNRLATELADVRLVLIVDVGGGTTDFTLVRLDETGDTANLRRVAVGDHLMLGGDNMDAALARFVEERLAAGGRRLAAGQWDALVQSCRAAKEALLADSGPEEFRVAVAGRSSALMGGTLTATLTRAEAEQIVLEGFLPRTAARDVPARTPRNALQELGLPFAREAAIPRHLAAFLAAHRMATRETAEGSGRPDLPRPDAILLNGGVFNSPRLARRVVEVVSAWWPDRPPIPVLPSASLDLAVARGAAAHGLARRGLTQGISGGSSHAVFIGLEAGPGGPATALCVVPRGLEEGRTVDLSGRVFRLTLGRPVRFPLFTSTSDRLEAAGDLVMIDDDLKPLPPLHALLEGSAGGGGQVPVHLRVTLTELGTLELWCVAEESEQRWRLEFELRGNAAEPAAAVGEPLPPRFADAASRIGQVFAVRAKPGKSQAGPSELPTEAARAAKQLTPALEQILGPREHWRLPVLRELWSRVRAGAARRRRTAEHERAFFQLVGFTLRPGLGYPLDDWRCEQTAALYAEGVQFTQEATVWNAFWVAWRRLAAGLSPERHQEIWQHLRPHLAWRIDPGYPRHAGRPKGPQAEGLPEMVRLAASLEHLEPAQKAELGGWVAAQLRLPTGATGPWAWALGRLGARVPLAASQHQAVAPELAAEWLRELETAHARGADAALFSLVQIARRTGDRSRQLDEDSRALALTVLRAAKAPPAWEQLVTEVTVLDRADEARALGDTLPVGLTL